MASPIGEPHDGDARRAQRGVAFSGEPCEGSGAPRGSRAPWVEEMSRLEHSFGDGPLVSFSDLRFFVPEV